MEMPVIQKLLAAAGEAGTVVATDEARERTLPVDGQAFEPFEKLLIEQRRAGQENSYCFMRRRLAPLRPR